MPQVAEVAVVQRSPPPQALALALSPSLPPFFFFSLSLSLSLCVFQRQKQSEAVPAAFGISSALPAPPSPAAGWQEWVKLLQPPHPLPPPSPLPPPLSSSRKGKKSSGYSPVAPAPF